MVRAESRPVVLRRLLPSHSSILAPSIALMAASAAFAGSGSLDPRSPEIGAGLSPADVAVYDRATCAATILWSAAELGVPQGGNVDAFSDRRDVFPANGPASPGFPAWRWVECRFSVDRTTVGLDPVVIAEATTDGAASDIFGYRFSPSVSGVMLIRDGECLTPGIGVESDIDAIARSESTTYPVFYSVDRPTARRMGVGPADILMVASAGAAPVVVASAVELGLVPPTTGAGGAQRGDDLDALAISPEGIAFSLTRDSPTAAADPLVGSGGLFTLGAAPWAFAAQLGLLPGDELNAIAIGDPEERHCGAFDPARGVMCEDPVTKSTAQTSVWRIFDLRGFEHGFEAVEVDTLAAAVESYDFLVDMRLWKSASPDPLAPRQLLASSPVLYPAGTPQGTPFTHLFDEVDCGSDFLWVEMAIPPSPNYPFDGKFRWGATGCEDAPTFLSSNQCGLPDPVDLDLLGWPDHAWSMTLWGFHERPFEIFHGAFSSGFATRLTVTGGNPGDPVVFLASTNGPGLGPVLPGFGGLSIDLLPPILPLGLAPIGPTGSTSLVTPPLPPLVPGLELTTQAIVRSGPGGADSQKSSARPGVVLK